MSYKIQLIEENQIVAVTYIGDISLDVRLSAVHDICSNYNQFKFYKLLIDSRQASQQMSKNEQIIFGRYLAEREEFRNALVATLSTSDNTINKVIVKEASSLGYQISCFDNKQQAVNWLKGAT
ncbi:MAG: hypothetical protein GY951_15070 [Psychromonas sp.]|nr:hypothetical protein [Alteromonadales bacterium]MCP5079363.1 hypothetical protein [Psychromonas sp.]